MPCFAALYRACDIFVAPSQFKSFGLILLEAMMFAKPVIGCRAGGMVEVVEHGEFGLLAEPGIFRFVHAAFAAADCGRWSASSSRFGRRRLTERLFTPERMVEGVLASL